MLQAHYHRVDSPEKMRMHQKVLEQFIDSIKVQDLGGCCWQWSFSAVRTVWRLTRRCRNVEVGMHAPQPHKVCIFLLSMGPMILEDAIENLKWLNPSVVVQGWWFWEGGWHTEIDSETASTPAVSTSNSAAIVCPEFTLPAKYIWQCAILSGWNGLCCGTTPHA